MERCAGGQTLASRGIANARFGWNTTQVLDAILTSCEVSPQIAGGFASAGHKV
jgi:hypothetical protein